MFTGFGETVEFTTVVEDLSDSFFDLFDEPKVTTETTEVYTSMFAKAVCVKRCPEAENDQPNCTDTIALGNCKVENNPFLQKSHSYMRICIPDDFESIRANLGGDLQINSVISFFDWLK